MAELVADVADRRLAGWPPATPDRPSRAGPAGRLLRLRRDRPGADELGENAVKYTPAGTQDHGRRPSRAATRSSSPSPTPDPASRRHNLPHLFESSPGPSEASRVPGTGHRAGDQQGVGRGARRPDLGREPGRRRDDVPLYDPARHASMDAAGGVGVSGERVLVVDDEPQIRRALRTALTGHGYAVELAEDGRGGPDAVWPPTCRIWSCSTW